MCLLLHWRTFAFYGLRFGYSVTLRSIALRWNRLLSLQIRDWLGQYYTYCFMRVRVRAQYIKNVFVTWRSDFLLKIKTGSLKTALFAVIMKILPIIFPLQAFFVCYSIPRCPVLYLFFGCIKPHNSPDASCTMLLLLLLCDAKFGVHLCCQLFFHGAKLHIFFEIVKELIHR